MPRIREEGVHRWRLARPIGVELVGRRRRVDPYLELVAGAENVTEGKDLDPQLGRLRRGQ